MHQRREHSGRIAIVVRNRLAAASRMFLSLVIDEFRQSRIGIGDSQTELTCPRFDMSGRMHDP